MSFSTDVLVMVGGTSLDVPLGQTKSICIWIGLCKMVSGLGGLRYHTGNPNVRLRR